MRHRSAPTLALILAVLAAAPVRADAVEEWNRIALHAVVDVAERPPAAAFVDLATVQLAVHEAFRDLARDVDRSAKITAAVARAAHDALVALYPEQRAELDARLATTLGLGSDAARRVLESRRDAGRDAAVPFVPSSKRDAWRPTPPSFAPAQTPWIAKLRPFAIPSPDAFRPAPPPAPDDPAYRTALAEVERAGAREGADRTPAQTEQARFWSEHAASQYGRYFLRLAEERKLDPAEKARFLAAVNVAGADALIACFDAKYAYAFWRPVQALEGWTPLLDTPNHPEYPSAHACLTEAVTRTVAKFFGTSEIATTVDSAVTGTTRTFATLDELAQDVNESRILGGLHYRFSIEAGKEIGRKVADAQ
jgi:hypothetical protein